MASYEERLKQLKYQMEDEEVKEYDDDSEEEIDIIEERVGGSESEQDVSDNEVGLEYFEHEDMFLGKDKSTKWMKLEPVKTESKTEVRLPGPSYATLSLETSMDVFKYFVNDEMIDIIVQNTNLYIDSIAEKFKRERDARHTDPTEITALIGLLLHAGLLNFNRLNVKEIWSSDGSGIEIFRLAMSLQRFRFLLRCLRFDNKSTREKRLKTDKLALIREFFDKFVNNCKGGYSLSDYVTIDEMLEGFRGKCSFKQFILSKPCRYGIKVFALTDAKMYYTSNLEIYVGQQPDGPYKQSNSPNEVVERLCSIIKGSGRNVTLDTWFTSIPLLEKLLWECNLTVIGAIRKNMQEVPLEFSRPRHPEGACMTGFANSVTLVSFVPKKGKNVLLASTLHQDVGSIIEDYNVTKSGVEMVDSLCAKYNVARNTKRWPMVIFYSILNIACINSLVVHSSNKPATKMTRRSFLRGLAHDLIYSHLSVRVQMEQLPRSLKFRLRELCGMSDEVPGPSDLPKDGKRGRCGFCSSRKSRKTRFFCRKCGKFMCLEHIVSICDDCYENANN